MKRLRILVVGAGPAGLTAARVLRRHGSVRLVERRHGTETGGVGIYVPGNGVRMLDAMGLLDAALDAGRPIASQEMRDATTGRVIGCADLSSIWPERWPCLAMPRSRLLEVLATGLDVPIEHGHGLASLETDGEIVQVTFDDGTEEELDLVVAADGVSSSVRRALWPDCCPSYAGESYWRSLVPRRAGWIDRWTGFVGSGRLLGVIPVGREQAYCFGLVLQDEPDDLPAEWDTMHERFRGFSDIATEVIHGIDPTTLTFNHAWVVTTPTMVRGRCVLIGDAAHANSPSMAQGAALAFEDAVVLGSVLDQGGGLDAYDRARADRIRYVAVNTRQRTEGLKLPDSVRTEVLSEFHSITKSAFGPLHDDPRDAIPNVHTPSPAI